MNTNIFDITNNFFNASNRVYCSSCESVVLDLSREANKYYETIPSKYFLN